MRLKKEFLICFTIILFIVFLEIILNIHFENEKKEIDGIVNYLQDNIQNSEDISDALDRLYEKWCSFEKIASYYTEHNELEKVSLKVVLLKKNIEVNEFNYAIEYLEEIKFWLNHILEKDKIKLKNIF